MESTKPIPAPPLNTFSAPEEEATSLLSPAETRMEMPGTSLEPTASSQPPPLASPSPHSSKATPPSQEETPSSLLSALSHAATVFPASASFGLSLVALGAFESAFSTHFSPLAFTLAVAMLFLGALISNAGIRSWSVSWRRKLIAADALFFVGALLVYAFLFFPSLALPLVGRLFSGMGVGIISAVAPLHIADAAPPRWEGCFKTMHSLSIGLGVVAGCFLNWAGGGAVCAAACATAVVQGVAMAVAEGRVGRRGVRGSSGRAFVVAGEAVVGEGVGGVAVKGMEGVGGEAAEVTVSLGVSEEMPVSLGRPLVKRGGRGLRSLLMLRRARKSVFVAVLLHAAQSFCGNCYLSLFIERLIKSPWAGVGFNGLGAVVTLVTAPLVDMAGRRVMLLGSSGVLLCGLLCMLMDALRVVGAVIFVVGFCLGLNSIPWAVVDEIFEEEYVGPGGMLCVGTNYLGAFVMVASVTGLEGLLGEWVLLPFVVFMVLFIGLVWVMFSETRGRRGQFL